MGAALVTAGVLVAANVVMIVVLVGRRGWVARKQRRYDRLVQPLRRSAVVLLESDPPGGPPPLARAERKIFAGLLAGYSRQLTGPSRDRIVAYFEATGAVDEQIALLRSRRSWRRAAAAFTLGDMAVSYTHLTLPTNREV